MGERMPFKILVMILATNLGLSAYATESNEGFTAYLKVHDDVRAENGEHIVERRFKSARSKADVQLLCTLCQPFDLTMSSDIGEADAEYVLQEIRKSMHNQQRKTLFEK
jgi:hypothetical protein